MVLSIEDLERRIAGLLENPGNRLVLDTNAIKAFFNENVEGLDFSNWDTFMIDSFPVLSYMRHVFKNDYHTKEGHVGNIRAQNRDHVALLSYLFNHFPNMLLPAGVKRETQGWVDHQEVDAYFNWRNTGNLAFNQDSRARRFEEVAERPFYMLTFDAQYEYLQMLGDFLSSIPKRNMIDYAGDPRKVILLQAISDQTANIEDRDIFADAYLGAKDSGGNDLYIVSFDLGMREIAKDFTAKMLNQGIGIHVLNGYGMVKPKKRGPEHRRMERLFSTAA